MLTGLSTSNEFPRVDPVFEKTVRSFRSLSAAEADQIRPNRLRFHTVQRGDTWESLARRARWYGAPNASSLAIMNGQDPKIPPQPGSRVRVVVGG